MSKHPEKRGGDNHRQVRVEKEIRDVVGTYLIGSFKGEVPGFVSLTRVVCSGDLKLARLHITLILNREEGETPEAFEKRQVESRKITVKELNEQAVEVQRRLAQVLQMRFTPKVTFFYDEGYESAMKIEQILTDMSAAGKSAPPAKKESENPEE